MATYTSVATSLGTLQQLGLTGAADKLVALSDGDSMSVVFNGNTTSTKTDTYGFTLGLPTGATPASVSLSLTVKFAAYNDAAITTRPVAYIGGTVYYGTTISGAPGATTTATQVWDTNPATGSAWTKADIDAAEFGVAMNSLTVSIEFDQVTYSDFVQEMSLTSLVVHQLKVTNQFFKVQIADGYQLNLNPSI